MPPLAMPEAAATFLASLGIDYPPIPAFWVWVILILFFGVPVVSFAVLLVFAATTQFDVKTVRLKGESLKGILAASAARMALGEMDSLYLPLEVVLTKKGLLPIVVHVKDVELKLYIEDEYISTITESESFLIEHGKQEVIVPVHTQVTVEGRLKDFYQIFQGIKQRNYEMKLALKGHLIVKHWFFTRSVPVKVSQYQLLRPAEPHVKGARWSPVDEKAWKLSVEVHNPLRAARIEGELEVALVRDRLLLPDRERERRRFDVDLGAGETRTLDLSIQYGDGAGERGLYPVVYFKGRRVWPGFLAKEAPRSRL